MTGIFHRKCNFCLSLFVSVRWLSLLSSTSTGTDSSWRSVRPQRPSPCRKCGTDTCFYPSYICTRKTQTHHTHTHTHRHTHTRIGTHAHEALAYFPLLCNLKTYLQLFYIPPSCSQWHNIRSELPRTQHASGMYSTAGGFSMHKTETKKSKSSSERLWRVEPAVIASCFRR